MGILAVRFFSIVFFLSLFTHVLAPTACTEDLSPIRISLIQSLTGISAIDGNTVLNAAKLAADKINKENPSAKIILEVEDDSSETKNAISAFHHQLSNKPDAIVGGTWSFIVNALAPLAAQSKTVMFNSSTVSDGIDVGKYNGFVYTLSASAEVENGVFDTLFSENQTVVLISGPTSYSEVHKNAFRKLAESKGLKVLQEILYDNVAADGITSLAPKIKQLNPDFIFVLIVPEKFDGFIRRLSELEVRSRVIADKNAYYAFKRSGIKSAYNGLCTSYPLESLLSKPEFVKAYQERYKEEPQMYSDISYDSIFLLYKAITTARRTGESLNTTLLNLDFTGIAGSYALKDNRYLTSVAPSLICIENGEAKIVH